MISTADLCTEKIRNVHDDYLFEKISIGNGFSLLIEFYILKVHLEKSKKLFIN